MSRISSIQSRVSRASGVGPEYGLVDDFQSGELQSEGESTALSSLLPIVTSSSIRANAPRAALPGITEDYGLSSRSNASSSKKRDDLPPRELDEYTVDTVRPIDSVYIYPTQDNVGPTNGSTGSSRQRRNYKGANNRSNSASTRSGDGGASLNGTTHSGATSVGGILETLGLGLDSSTVGDESYSRGTRDSLTRDTRSFGRSTLSRSTFTNHHRGSYSYNNKQSGPQVHFRACVVLFFLLSVLYGSFQWISLLQSSGASKLAHKRRSRNRKARYHAFEEGEDRPIYNAAVANRLNASPSKVESKLAKVPKEDNGPESSDADLAKKGARGTSKKPPSEDREESAPSDKLESIQKSQTREDKEEDIDGPEISFAVKTGLSNIFKKDKARQDTPFLWYIPRSGGGMVKNVLSNCKDLVLASEVGATMNESKGSSKLEIVTVAGHKYVNVDTTTEAGIRQAKTLSLASSGFAELVVTPRFQDGASLFSAAHKGRAFAMIRHPVERAVSMYYFLLKHRVPAIMKMSLEEYCKSSHVENNWMVRILSNKMTGDVSDDDLTLAKRTLRDHVIIGLLEQKEESMKRFEYYFQWRYTENPTKQTACRSRILMGDHRTNESAKGKVKEGSQAWSLLMWQNKLDMKLFKYAKALYLQQGAELFADMP